jgi:hypothetical protein
MAREAKLSSHGEQIVEPIDLDELGSQSRSCLSNPWITKDDFLSEDSIPLFLSGAAEEPEQPGSGKGWHGAVILTLTAAAIGFAISSVGNPLWLFASTKASLPVMPARQPDTGVPAPAVQSAASAAPPVAGGAPTRDDIAAAFRAVQRGQAGIRQPSAAAPPARHLKADELAALLNRAKGLIAIGDIVSARLLLERAADAQEAGAALLLAQTYDPAVLGTPDARSITPDPAMARAWYQKAAEFGSPDARQRLAQMHD